MSIPVKGELKKELGICGSKSGRDMDKFDVCNLTAEQGQIVDCPIIKEANLHIECRVVAKTLLAGDKMNNEIIDMCYDADYDNGDYHTLFFGEIVDCYILD